MNSAIDVFVNAILKNAGDAKQKILSLQEIKEATHKVDIDKFISILYSLMKEKNLLIDESSDQTEGNGDVTKFLLTEGYPDGPGEVNTTNTVAFEITRRTCAKYTSGGANTPGAEGFTQFRPRYIGEGNIVQDGDYAVFYEQSYDNVLTFTCWSEKTGNARKMARILENFFIKHYYYLRQFVPVLVYTGRDKPIFTSEYSQNRLYGIPLQFFIRTNEFGYVQQDEIATIDIYGSIDKTGAQLNGK